MKTSSSFLIAHITAFSLLLAPINAYAAVPEDEIVYSSITATNDESIHITQKGPWGEMEVRCDRGSFECEQFSPTKDPFLHDQERYSSVSFQNSYGLTISNNTLLTVYDLSNPKQPRERVKFSLNSPTTMARFSRDESSLILVDTYTLTKLDLRTGTFSFIPYNAILSAGNFLISPNGNNVSHFRYDTAGNGFHRVYSFTTQTFREFPSEVQNYFEISESGRFGAFLDLDEEGRYVIKFVDLSNPLSLPTVALTTLGAIDDYTFSGEYLYITSNKEGGYDWDLFRYNPATSQLENVVDVSYGDYVRPYHNGVLFPQIEGNDTVIAYVENSSKSIQRFPTLEEKTKERKIEKRDISNASMHAVLWSPTGSDNKEYPLIVWLHGGPQRQTSLGYHPYLSYAVYDELLERLVEGGARVLRLDYTGSWGYGKAFQDALKGNIGVSDVRDVNQAVEYVTTTYNTEKVFLMGNSYGGYLALKTLVENPATYARAVSIAGVTDWEELIRRIPTSPFVTQFGAEPGPETGALYTQANITLGLPNLTSDNKIFVAYGEEDATVPVWQSTNFIEILKRQNIEHETLVFQDEGHIITKRKNLDELCEEVSSFLSIRTTCEVED